MAIRVVRLGTARARGEGFRIGTVRRPPRAVLKEDLGKRDFYDLWLPELAPSAALLSRWRAGKPTTARWASFAARYRREVAKPPAQRLILLLAAMSSEVNFSVGCYCEVEGQCHRSLLKRLLVDAGARVV